MSRKLNLKVVLASAAVAGAAMAVQSAAVRATTGTWQPTSAGSYDWNVATNWSSNPAFPNAATDIADLTRGLTGNQTISLGQGITLSSLNLGTATANGDGLNTYTVGGVGGHVLTVGSITENPGSAGDTIASPISSAGLNIYNSSTNALALTGTNSQVTTLYLNSGMVKVSGGTLSTGTSNYLMTRTGGTFGVTGGTVTTPSTTGLLVAYSGAGTVNVSSGTLTPGANASHIYLANQSGSTTGTLNVSGGVVGNSSDLTKTYTLYMTGDGTLANTTADANISGGQVYLNQILMQPGASGTTVATSNYTQTGGTVTVYSGNYNNIGGGTVVAPATGPGTAMMSVSGGTLSVGGITLGTSGILDVSGTGSVDNSQAMQLGTGATVNLSGGTLTIPELAGASGGFTGTFNFTGGTLAMFNPSLAYDPITTASNTGTFTNAGGTLAVGGVGTTGETLLAGNYTQTAGTLAIDIGGVNQGAKTNGYDLLNSAGTGSGLVSLGGDLSVSLVNGFTPTSGDQFVFLLSKGISGAFANVAVNSRISVTGGSGSFELLQSGNELYLSNFESAAIPEPATLGLLAITGVGLLLMRPRRA